MRMVGEGQGHSGSAQPRWVRADHLSMGASMHRCTWLGGARAQWERVAQARNSSKHGSKHASMHVGGVVGERGKGTAGARALWVTLRSWRWVSSVQPPRSTRSKCSSQVACPRACLPHLLWRTILRAWPSAGLFDLVADLWAAGQLMREPWVAVRGAWVLQVLQSLVLSCNVVLAAASSG